MCRRLIAWLLAALLALGCVSCADEPSEAPALQRLEIEEVSITYSQALLEEMERTCASLLERWTYAVYGMRLSDKERAELSALVKSDVLPILCGVRVSEAEWQMLARAADVYCTTLEKGEASFSATADFYSSFMGVLGLARAGEAARRGLAVYLSERILVCEERYRTYGYAWYLEDAERYRAQAKALEGEISASDLAAAMSVAALFDLADVRLGTGGWPTGVLLGVWQWQAAHMQASEIPAEKWELMAQMLSDLQPRTRDTALRAELAILQDEGRLAHLFAAMPELLAFYRLVVEGVQGEELALLREGEPQKATALLCQLICEREEDFLQLLSHLEALCVKESEAEKKAIASLGLTAELEAFFENVPVHSATELFDAVAACAVSGDAEALYLAGIGYLRGLMPYLAFAVYNEGGT